MHPLLVEGLSDAVGLMGGALAGYGVAVGLGADPMTPGYHAASLAGIAAIGPGGGLGLHLARRWRAARASQEVAAGDRRGR